MTVRELGEPGDLGWVVMTHGETYSGEICWDTSFETLVAGIVADYASSNDPTREAAWIAEVDDRRAGCVFCVAADQDTAKLRILLVDPDTRGQGVGGELIHRCVDFAREAAYARMTLWTNDPLVSAARLYPEAGFRITARRSLGRDRPAPTVATIAAVIG